MNQNGDFCTYLREMLTDFQNSITRKFSHNFNEVDNEDPMHQSLDVSLEYLVKFDIF